MIILTSKDNVINIVEHVIRMNIAMPRRMSLRYDIYIICYNKINSNSPWYRTLLQITMKAVIPAILLILYIIFYISVLISTDVPGAYEDNTCSMELVQYKDHIVMNVDMDVHLMLITFKSNSYEISNKNVNIMFIIEECLIPHCNTIVSNEHDPDIISNTTFLDCHISCCASVEETLD